MMPDSIDEKNEIVVDEAEFEFDHDLYSKISIAARLRDIKLLANSYQIKPDVFEVIKEFEDNGEMAYGFHGESVSFYYEGESGLAIGTYRWTAEIKSGRKKVLKHSSDYLVAYNGLEDFDEMYVRFFFEKVGRFATYPYFRALFSQLSSASGIQMAPLPSLNERVD